MSNLCDNISVYGISVKHYILKQLNQCNIPRQSKFHCLFLQHIWTCHLQLHEPVLDHLGENGSKWHWMASLQKSLKMLYAWQNILCQDLQVLTLDPQLPGLVLVWQTLPVGIAPGSDPFLQFSCREPWNSPDWAHHAPLIIMRNNTYCILKQNGLPALIWSMTTGTISSGHSSGTCSWNANWFHRIVAIPSMSLLLTLSWEAI